LINKSFKQLNAERAVRRVRYTPTGIAMISCKPEKNKKKKKNNKSSSARAGGPAPEESGFKRPSLTGRKL